MGDFCIIIQYGSEMCNTHFGENGIDNVGCMVGYKYWKLMELANMGSNCLSNVNNKITK